MYSITTNLAKNRVIVVFVNDFEHGQAFFNTELKEAVKRVRAEDRHFDLLADFSTAPVMSQQIAGQGEEMINWCVANGLRKSANVMNTILQRMQVKRVSANDDKFQYFSSLAEAEAWLDS